MTQTSTNWTPSITTRLVLGLYRLLWLLAMPLVLFYLWRRGRKDARYSQQLAQRFGFHERRDGEHVWIHAVSIGELRSAVPLIRALLDRGEMIVTTHFTPAGAREAEKIFADEIARGRVTPVWVPFDYGLAFARFFRAFRPKYGFVMEVEFWPGMILSARRHGVPLFLCNGQYPVRSFERDRNKRISAAAIVPGFAGAFVKTKAQAARFRELGLTNLTVTGEMRFDQPVSKNQAGRADALRTVLNGRRVITFASVVEGEDAVFLASLKQLFDTGEHPLIVYVPRAPERFDDTTDMLRKAGFSTARRSDILNTDLAPIAPLEQVDVLIGDSLGEMYFYLGLCDLAVIGGGFNPAGSHNIVEPLTMEKPVIVGPEIWTIETPATEAIAAEVVQQVTKDGLADALIAPRPVDPEAIRAFLADHRGAVDRTLAALPRMIESAGLTSR